MECSRFFVVINYLRCRQSYNFVTPTFLDHVQFGIIPIAYSKHVLCHINYTEVFHGVKMTRETSRPLRIFDDCERCLWPSASTLNKTVTMSLNSLKDADKFSSWRARQGIHLNNTAASSLLLTLGLPTFSAFFGVVRRHSRHSRILLDLFHACLRGCASS